MKISESGGFGDASDKNTVGADQAIYRTPDEWIIGDEPKAARGYAVCPDFLYKAPPLSCWPEVTVPPGSNNFPLLKLIVP